MVRPASRPGVWTYARSTSPPTPIATTNRVSTVPQDQRWSDIDTERPLKQTREPSEATSSSRNEDTEFDTVSTTAAPAANQVATDLLISIGGPESEDSQDDEESEFEVALERRRGSRTTSSRSNDSAIRSQVSDTVADLLNLGLDFTAGDKLEISDTDWIKALDGMKSAAKTQDQDKNKNSDAIFGPEKVLIDFFASSASDRSLTPAPSSGSAGNLMFNSVEQDEPVTDLIGALDESTATLPSKLTGGTEKEANEVSAFNNHRDDLEELFSLKAVWQESHQRGDYGIDNDTNSDSDNDSYDSDATDATDATDADPWRILADDKIFLSMDALESIRLDLQQHNVTWEQLLTEVKI
ncbi:hypothetical protein BGX34_006740 [Mortierella sp. NVP85]|nr:hypothetical protein BGX34_006740 [Mortierella sp. NVP85]